MPRKLVGVVNKMAEIMILLQSLSKNGKNSRTPENAFDNADLQSTMLLSQRDVRPSTFQYANQQNRPSNMQKTFIFQCLHRFPMEQSHPYKSRKGSAESTSSGCNFLII